MQRFAIAVTGMLALVLLAGGPAWALDEDADAFAFLPSDAPMVVAIDMDELGLYLGSVEGGWRDADRAHFSDSLGTLSNLFTKETGKPDVLTFFGALSGVQALAVDPSDQIELAVFSTSGDRNRRLLRSYTAAYVAEHNYREAVDTVVSALRSYYNETLEDEETGEEIPRHTYPQSLDELVEGGYLDELPENPYTGETMQVLTGDEPDRLGDIRYRPLQSSPGCCGETCNSEGVCDDEPENGGNYVSFELTSCHIGGILTSGPWSKSYRPFGDLSDELRKFESNYTWEGMGFEVIRDGGWEFFKPDLCSFAFASGDRFLLFGKSVDQLMAAVEGARNGEGYHFSQPDDFDTAGAFYRDEADLTMMADQVRFLLGMQLGAPETEGLIEGLGLEALSRQHTACRLRRGDITSVRRVELSGEAQESMVGSMAYAQPSELMTAERGPFDLIGEVAWANPGEYVQGAVNFALESILPIVASEMGMEGMDPSMMLGVMGLGEVETLLPDEMYVLITSSEDRGDGVYVPGVVIAYKSDNPDLGYTLVGLYDSLSFSIPDFPLYKAEMGDENAATWMMSNEVCPISPTLAWTDGWVVEALWREDALAARDALAAGMLLSPDGMGPANARVRFNRRALLLGLADTAYAVPGGEVAPAGLAFDLLARLTDRNERLFAETVGNGEYVETRTKFSLGLGEDLVPLLSYVVRSGEVLGLCK